MRIQKIEAYELRLPLKQPFVTSYGTFSEKALDIFVITDELGNRGYGELVSFEHPEYIEETLENSRQIIKNNLVPLLVQSVPKAVEVNQIFQVVRGNFMAKSALETACWDLFAKREHKSLTNYFSGSQKDLAVGVSIGIQPLDKLIETVQSYVAEGYARVKLKIKPGYDYEPLAKIRKFFPELVLMADANSAYSLADLNQLQKLDELDLAMLEQPFSQRDFVDHAFLQAKLRTPICLDENIRTLEDVQTAYALKSCQAINLKIPRVGGITEALKIYQFCMENNLVVWLGGMFESGIGRSLNLQFASQIGMDFPGDISGSNRYFFEDIVTTPAVVKKGRLAVPQGLGIGVELDFDQIEKNCKQQIIYFQA